MVEPLDFEAYRASQQVPQKKPNYVMLTVIVVLVFVLAEMALMGYGIFKRDYASAFRLPTGSLIDSALHQH